MKYIENATPAWSFGIREKDFYKKPEIDITSKPGPGTYEVDKAFKNNIGKGKEYIFCKEERKV